MEFSNLFFLYILLPAVLLIYFLLPDMNRKNLALTIISLVFYSMGQPIYMVLMVGLCYLNYRFALRINSEERGSFLIPVAVNIAVLAVFKYLDFFLNTIGLGVEGGLIMSGLKALVKGLNGIGFSFQEPTTVLPIGISFYTFSAISYLADVYNRKIDPEEKFRNLLLYFMMFPKLLQGPIVRYEQIADQLEVRKHHPRAMFEGMQRFFFGLAKKVLIADYCGKILSELNSGGADTTLVGVWFAAVLFMFQIYYDFSGYSDMAIGLGKVFGFRYCENFDRPYLSLSITEFWRRWHMSLGSFFRDYVYIPLGGNRMGKPRQVFNMFVVWTLTGLWHGASWNFVIWGLYFFVILVVEKHYMSTLETLPDWVCRCITLWLVLVGWIIFSHENFKDLQAAFAAMLGFGGFGTPGLGTRILNSLPLLVVCFIGCTPVPVYVKRIVNGVCGMGRRREKPNQVTPLRIAHMAVSLAVMCLLLWLCTISLVGSTSAPSIYGNF